MSPCIWTLVSDIILSVLTIFYAGSTTSAQDGSALDVRHAEMFVDNNFQGINESGVRRLNVATGQTKTIIEVSRDSNQVLKRHISLTGVTLRLYKTRFYYLLPNISGTKKRYRPRHHEKADFNLTKIFSKEVISLHQLYVNEPYRILGILKEPTDNNKVRSERM